MTEQTSLDPLHPRPQFRRERWIDLSGTWQFAFDDDTLGLAERWFGRETPFNREIIVPYPPESALSGVHETGWHEPDVWTPMGLWDPVCTLDPSERMVCEPMRDALASARHLDWLLHRPQLGSLEPVTQRRRRQAA